jgi:hypothetical protein
MYNSFLIALFIRGIVFSEVVQVNIQWWAVVLAMLRGTECPVGQEHDDALIYYRQYGK